MTSRCRWLLGLGCWTLSVLVAPDTWKSIGTDTPSTAYATLNPGSPGSPGTGAPDVRVAEHPFGRDSWPALEAARSSRR